MSITSGITLASHVAGVGETSLQISQILMMAMTQKQHPSYVVGWNIIAMDRGYWSEELILWLSQCGFQLIGTHKQVPSFPYTFGTKNAKLVFFFDEAHLIFKDAPQVLLDKV